jgi:hypothetical protein
MRVIMQYKTIALILGLILIGWMPVLQKGGIDWTQMREFDPGAVFGTKVSGSGTMLPGQGVAITPHSGSVAIDRRNPEIAIRPDRNGVAIRPHEGNAQDTGDSPNKFFLL